MHPVKKACVSSTICFPAWSTIFLVTEKITLTDIVLCERGCKVEELRRTVAPSPSTYHVPRGLYKKHVGRLLLAGSDQSVTVNRLAICKDKLRR
jgi:hypothetical protein